MAGIDRRRFLGLGIAATAGAVGASAFESQGAAFAVVRAGDGPYGPLGVADANGIQLPDGFRARELARGDMPVAGSDSSGPSSRTTARRSPPVAAAGSTSRTANTHRPAPVA
jgi:hypothetical protein